MKKIIGSALSFILIIALGLSMLIGVNSFTAPIIAEKNAAGQFAPLLSVMPEAQGFDKLYDAEDAASSALSEIPAAVTGIYSETSGLGYVIQMSTSEGYTKLPMILTMAVDAEGKISAIELNETQETKPMTEGYVEGYVGQDSALPDVGLVAGVTYSSSAFKNAVSDGFAALISNGLVGAGVKSDDQVLMELVAEKFPGISNAAGVLQYEEFEAGGCFITGMKALNGSGIACIADGGDATLLAIGSVLGGVKLYNATGEDVTASYQSVAAEIAAAVAENCKSFAADDMGRVSKLVPEGAEIEELKLDGVFNSITTAYTIKIDDTINYAFVSRPYAYSNECMQVFYVLDEQGAIVNMTAAEFILYADYFSAYTLDKDSYREGFHGLSASDFTGEQALISGATVSSDAISTATADVFEAFAAIK